MTSLAKACLPLLSLNFTPSFIVEPAKVHKELITIQIICTCIHGGLYSSMMYSTTGIPRFPRFQFPRFSI